MEKNAGVLFFIVYFNVFAMEGKTKEKKRRQ